MTWTDGDDSGPVPSMVGGRETRKMNVYQAVRDALRYIRREHTFVCDVDMLAA